MEELIGGDRYDNRKRKRREQIVEIEDREDKK